LTADRGGCSTWNIRSHPASVPRGTSPNALANPRYNRPSVRDLSAILQSELDALRTADRLRSLPELAGRSRQRPDGPAGPLISFASNDYLGLASHPAVLTAAAESATREGFGAGAARLVTGDLPAHRALERDLAMQLNRPGALLFPTGYQANIGVLATLAGPEDLIVSDALNHASLIDGCRLSRATVAIYAHADADAATVALSQAGTFRRRFLVTESLFSMDGDVAPLAKLAEAALVRDAIFIVDEAHALGVLGPAGMGLCADVGVHPDVLIGTLGKAFGSAGGFVTGSVSLRDYLLNRARTFVFTTSVPPPVAAAARAGLQLAAGSEGDVRRARLASNRRRLFALLAPRVRAPAVLPPGPIIPLILGADARALAVARFLRARGFIVPAIRPPTVPEGTARLRVTVSSEHSAAEIDAFAAALTEVLA
jgi:8-amino-7-oxononanoate synthase